MKALQCEMCGSQDLVKDGGVFVCQSCGTKYTVEEAKKMMVEGTVEVKGTVKVDTSDELKNLYEIARRAKDANNSANAAKYYDMILVKDPSSWEANFYVIYFNAMSCKIAEIWTEASNVESSINTVLELIKKEVNDEEEQKNILTEVTDKLIEIGQMFYTASSNHFAQFAQAQGVPDECANNVFLAGKIGYTLGDSIIEVFGEEKYKDLIIKAWSHGINCNYGARQIYWTASGNRVEPNNAVADEYRNKISALDPQATVEQSFIQNSGCMITLLMAISALSSMAICASLLIGIL